MTDTRTYLNVPYAQKDAAKALGAKWDPAHKKWYVPAGKDVALFDKWQSESPTLASPPAAKPKARAAAKTNSVGANGGFTVKTKAADRNFVAYDGDEPPWD